VISAVTVFCGSSDTVEEKYFAAARELGLKLARRDWRLVYGGGSVGLMGALAAAVRTHGGHVTGVIPKTLLDLGVGDRSVAELIVTDGLRDRKAIMDERGDAFVALPGGLGTLEEVLEALTLKQLGYHGKPIAVLDLDGYFDPLWAQVQRGIDTGFIKPEFLDLWYPAPDVDALLRYLESYVPHRYGSKWSGDSRGRARGE
jgi:cytokinin riboside 5'-monophosphate phosphoribohydrolase